MGDWSKSISEDNQRKSISEDDRSGTDPGGSRVIDELGSWIIDRSRLVVLLFLLLTIVFALGFGNISTEAGTQQFTEQSEAQDAFESVQQEFTPTFEDENGTTQLIQSGSNILTKKEMVAMLTVQKRLQDRESMRVVGTSSGASLVAQQLEPNATTLDAQIRTLEGASDAEIRDAVRRAAGQPQFASTVSTDFNPEDPSASATIGVVTHDVDVGSGQVGEGGGESSPMTEIQQDARHVVASVESSITVFGSGITASEFSNVIVDSLLLVIPAALLLILLFLSIAYRDPIDLLLGLLSLLMAVVWTFGALGLLGIQFTQMLIAIPPLLLAVGIDTGIHAVNRYREERVHGTTIDRSMRITLGQLLIAFFIVATTTVLGFASNGVSELGPIRDFGLVAALGIVFTFLIFGIFLPAAKVSADRWREKRGIPQFGSRPLGGDGSVMGRVLSVGVILARRGPYLLLAGVVLLSLVSGAYATGVDTSFSNEDFLPPEDVADPIESLPEPFAPEQYTVTRTLNFLEDNFETTRDGSVTIYVDGRVREDHALESIQQANRDPPDSFVASDRSAQPQSIISVISSYTAESPEFHRLVDRNDADGDGVPDDNLETIYDELLSSPYGPQAREYITEDYRSAKVVYSVKAEASQDEITRDGREMADRYRLSATATGQTVVFSAISETIMASATESLIVALVTTALFLVLIYRLIEGQASLGIVNLVPIVVAVALLAGSMRLFGIPFNALTATILAIAMGLGVDYSVHFVHRFADEFDESGELFPSLDLAVRGTGGALTGSMLTTVGGTGVLVLAVFPVLGQFGMLLGLTVVYSWLTTLLVTPATLVVWNHLFSLRVAR